MENEKMEALLRAALNATAEELSASPALSTGFSPSEQTWEVIVRYTGSLSTLQTEFPSIRFTELLNGYGILWISKSLVSQVFGFYCCGFSSNHLHGKAQAIRLRSLQRKTPILYHKLTKYLSRPVNWKRNTHCNHRFWY